MFLHMCSGWFVIPACSHSSLPHTFLVTTVVFISVCVLFCYSFSTVDFLGSFPDVLLGLPLNWLTVVSLKMYIFQTSLTEPNALCAKLFLLSMSTCATPSLFLQPTMFPNYSSRTCALLWSPYPQYIPWYQSCKKKLKQIFNSSRIYMQSDFCASFR